MKIQFPIEIPPHLPIERIQALLADARYQIAKVYKQKVDAIPVASFAINSDGYTTATIVLKAKGIDDEKLEVVKNEMQKAIKRESKNAN